MSTSGTLARRTVLSASNQVKCRDNALFEGAVMTDFEDRSGWMMDFEDRSE